jgi:hypothetical protein
MIFTCSSYSSRVDTLKIQRNAMVAMHRCNQFTLSARGADQAAYTHTVKVPAPSLSLGGGLDDECGIGSSIALPRMEAHVGVCVSLCVRAGVVCVCRGGL